MIFRIRQCNPNLFDSKLNLFLLTLFLLVFPKGGIKIAGVPLTWGYLLLGVFSLAALLKGSIRIKRERLIAYLCILPFQLFCALTMYFNGIASLGIAISFWVNFLFLPFAFYLLFSNDIDTFDVSFFFRIFRSGIFFIAAYGILLFAIKQLTGKFIEIPLLTTNLGDLGGLESKHINRGVVFKLISTYNNGNIFGVCLIILLPLYCLLEKSRWRSAIVKLSLILTFSRTVWIGLILHELCYPFLVTKEAYKTLLTVFSRLIAISICLIALLSYYGFAIRFLISSDLGGRKESITLLNTLNFFAAKPFDGISEIIYAGVAISFGWLALPLFLFAISTPLFYQILSKRLSIPHKCIALGLCNYLFISCSDGALLLIPTLAFYWFFLSLLHRKEIPYFCQEIKGNSKGSTRVYLR